ncbi:Short-chain dehydrogenase/reductase SDR [Azotobacter vinelandii CA]|uniref:Short-chain dehydrogenase/reductase SDR n=2 Tax=Azotobacter vinelandii TaxID=354 RepID=C1DR39_AZOVD|nr:Short-chain dehydrogenase/reductase SDR [Azotobacter vinelandii DJ]AGK14599.1 Short-chain dehydrogenase/reductase SDR [Azotobacter vinelandii CA]AGK21425.1 Short-chain dehydrogenase/reductase SDR [Azotobacter vinelandii CA6]GLK57919.1 hypothetical protein GCM10017624_00760 [Azotobacter vinelandii]SFX23579.1 short chain dehydrogenase [Azotobacter vinelandii]
MGITYDFKGQVALVTGAASGMGLATTRAFAAAGASVVLSDVNEAALQHATESLEDAGGDVIGVACDVSDEAQVEALVGQAVSTFGRLDTALNNAGIQVPASEIADQPLADFDRVTAVNLRGVRACMKHELVQTRHQGSGAIVNCSSIGGLVGRGLLAAYHGSKHGVVPDPQRRPRICRARHPRERRMSRYDRHAHGVEHAGQRHAGHG